MELVVFEMFIWVHFIAAVLAIMLGMINLVLEKGTPQHPMVGWFWLIIPWVCMVVS